MPQIVINQDIVMPLRCYTICNRCGVFHAANSPCPVTRVITIAAHFDSANNAVVRIIHYPLIGGSSAGSEVT